MFGDGPPAALSFPPCRKRQGRKGALSYGLVHPAGAVQVRTCFIVVTNTPSHPTSAGLRAACYETTRFVSSCFFNGYGKSALRSKSAGQYGFAETPANLFRTASEILSYYNFRGKDPRKPKRFSWSVQGGPEGNRNPSGLVFFCQRFLLEKQKKMLNGRRKFLI